ncbi:MAG: hypothetical protein ACR2L1_00340 [Pyrinomonadaceae bacterium]
MFRNNGAKSLQRNLLNLLTFSIVFTVVTACMCRPERESNKKEDPETNQNSAVEKTI